MKHPYKLEICFGNHNARVFTVSFNDEPVLLYQTTESMEKFFRSLIDYLEQDPDNTGIVTIESRLADAVFANQSLANLTRFILKKFAEIARKQKTKEERLYGIRMAAEFRKEVDKLTKEA